jgi:hypothetical protein
MQTEVHRATGDQVPSLSHRLTSTSRWAIIGILCFLPSLFVLRQFSAGHSFTKLLEVGPVFLPRALPQFQAIDPVTFHNKGYDGQFYAQVALDPLLRNKQLVTALDIPEYRSRRILMPALAWLLGLGRPLAVVTAYSFINLAAWYAMLTLLVRSERPQTIQDWLCLVAIMLTTGACASFQRSLTDLPAAALMVAAIIAAGISGPIFLALSVLTKETYAICAWAPLVDLRAKPNAFWRGLAQLALILLPTLIWAIYVRSRFPVHFYGDRNFSWPFEGWIYGFVYLATHRKFFGIVAMFSLLIQFIYLAIRRRMDSFYWRVAVSFAIASCFLSDDPFTSEVSFTRDLLPTTIGFNVLLMRDAPARFGRWFVAGNIGLSSGLIALIQRIF